VLGRCFEEAGISTTGVVFVKEHAERVKPPRMLWVPFAFGNALGRAGDPDLQHGVLRASLDLLERPRGPVLEEFPDDTTPEGLLQASAAEQGDDREAEPADELTALRPYYERWVDQNQGRSAVGLCGVPQRRFRGVVRFLQGYVEGERRDAEERPEETPLPQYLRYCVDDLKAFYYEARMAQRPEASDVQLHEWFWSETSMGRLIVQLAQHMGESDDAETKAIPFGLAR
jgi:hypothetical protein